MRQDGPCNMFGLMDMNEETIFSMLNYSKQNKKDKNIFW